MDSTEPADAIESAEPDEAKDQADANDSVDRWLKALSRERLDRYDGMGAR
jgi:hypothetical protein